MSERGGQPGESWVRLIYPGVYTVRTDDGTRQTDMSPQRLAELAANTNALLASFAARAPEGLSPYTLPVRVEHEPRGERLGNIQEVRFADLDAKGPALWALTRWTPAAWEKVEAVDIQHVSLGTEPDYVDELGQEFGEVLIEFSVVDHPLIKNIGTLQDSMALRASSNKRHVERFNNTPAPAPQDDAMTPEQIAALADAIGARVAQELAPITAKLDAALGTTPATPEATPTPAPEVDPTLAMSEEEKALEEAMNELEKEEAMNADAEATKEKEAMSARIKRLERCVLQLTSRAKGLQFSERGSSNPPRHTPKPAARGDYEARLAEAKAKGMKGDAAVAYALS